MSTSALYSALASNPKYLRWEISVARAQARFPVFARQAWQYVDPSPLIDGWYIDAIGEHLEAVKKGQIRQLIININPKMAKSTLCCVLFPVWLWIHDPSTRILTGSYDKTLATRDCVKARRLIESTWFKERWGALRPDGQPPVFTLAGDQNLKSRYDNSRKGYRYIVAPRAGTTGEGGDFLIGDDLISFIASLSRTELDFVGEWVKGAFLKQRLIPGKSPVVMIGQGLDVDDPFGVLLREQAGEWDVLCLQMRYRIHQVPADLSELKRGMTSTALTRAGKWKDPRTKADELLCPERWPEEAVRKEEKQAYNFRCQFQHDPPHRQGDDRKFKGFDPDSRGKKAPPIHELLLQIDEDGICIWEFGWAFDWGEHAGRTVGLLGAWCQARDLLWFIGEYVSPRDGMGSADHALEVETILRARGLPKHAIVKWIGDINSAGFEGAGKKVNDEMSDALDVVFEKPAKGKGSVELGLRVWDDRFLSGRCLVDTEACPRLTEGLSMWKGGDDEFVHVIDAGRYLSTPVFAELEAGGRTASPITKVKRRR